ncbi:cellulose biosynthesis cyclic di-GMP-binding regulatory protein BcsB [Pseudomonas sp. C27(2019)]|uniref:cellulose biosynthesis cyclic di-GMP-binding regulatory protein BcsB n=1 Tax=Pseudomonas sp. C27(2019) TaxID=2604941 RepID=UPI0015B544A6|nr:cellulose biosynthesis cyclic di-GMP-binding regulatory protein BcsB [Pseudomonas sp. C27(2019)]
MLKPLLYKLHVSLVGVLFCFLYNAVHAQTLDESSRQIESIESAVMLGNSIAEAPVLAPLRSDTYALTQLAQGDSYKLLGIDNTQQLEFTVRRDQLITDAELELVFTPSPALLPRLSHLRVYLNEEMMGVIHIEAADTGQQVRKTIKLDPRMMITFNRIRLEFVGHYTEICEDLAHSSLWLDISKKTQIRINQQALAITNDLSFFPEPFFDAGDMQAQELPFVFAGAPSNQQMQAGTILSSYFGTQAQWRDISFPVHYSTLPEQHAIVFATNVQRPEFLKDYPQVSGPVVDLISLPDNPYYKMLLVLGRDDDDLITAASALAIGNPLFRGQSVSINEVQSITPRQPYDAPNWVSTERPVFFSELVSYPGQLEVSGLIPRPIALNLNLPPDLFIWRNSGIPTSVIYRYTPPSKTDDSRLNLSINDNFIHSYSLRPSDEQGLLTKIRLPLRNNERASVNQGLLIPALKVGDNNQIRFDFSFASTLASAQRDTCQTNLPVDVRAAIDENSVIDFSGFRHYLAMPNLYAFAGSAFPFSRMADLSETVVVVPSAPSAKQARLVLEVMSKMGAQIGYPALKIRIMDDWSAASQMDADLLLIGSLPQAIKERSDAHLLLHNTQTRLRQARVVGGSSDQKNSHLLQANQTEREPQSSVDVQSLAPMAAIIGLQSELYPQRSIVGLLASSDEDFNLLTHALNNPGLRENIKGSVALIRESGVSYHSAGTVYYVGELPWWEWLWYHLSERPLLLAAIAFFVVLILSVMLWHTLRLLARRRLEYDA